MPRNIRDLASLAFPVGGILAAIGVGVFVIATHERPDVPESSIAGPTATQSATPQAGDRPSQPGSKVGSTPGAKPGTKPTTGTGTKPGATEPPTPGQTCVPTEVTHRLTVVTFNIHSARAHDGSLGLSEIAAELASWKPDVVLLQEVDRGRAWSARLDMPAVLAERLHMESAFGDNVRRSPTNQYGTAILSRYPIESWRNQLLPRPAGTQQRGLLRATLDVDGVPTNVYVTHLENSSPTARLLQMRAIAPVIRADAGPKLLGGDLNAVVGSPPIALARSVLSDTWAQIGAGDGRTAPGSAPRVRIDYLLYGSGGDTTITPERIDVLPRSLVSDHRAVRATYTLTTGGGEEICVPVIGEGDLPAQSRTR